MNEIRARIRLRDYMTQPDGWGRAQGREVYQRLIVVVEENPGVHVFAVSMEDVRRVDISFASETVVEIARRYRGIKGFCLIDLVDADMIENWEAAAAKSQVPLFLASDSGSVRVLGLEPSAGTKEAFYFVVERRYARAAEFAERCPTMSIASASSKFRQLWEQGFLLRREGTAESGGVEYVYQRAG